MGKRREFIIFAMIRNRSRRHMKVPLPKSGPAQVVASFKTCYRQAGHETRSIARGGSLTLAGQLVGRSPAFPPPSLVTTFTLPAEPPPALAEK